jgi:hypothetical protein
MKKVIALIFLGLVFACQSFAQTLPEAPAPKQHRFFDWINDSGLALSAVGIIGDSVTTQRFPQTGFATISEGNPLARPFTGSAKGQVTISAVGFGGEIGAMYLFHRQERRGHHPRLFNVLERATPFMVASVEFWIWERNTRLLHLADQQNQQACSAPGVVCK